jgi:hypothetical protein
MLRRIGLVVVMLVYGAALIVDAAAHQLPAAWVPANLATADRFLGTEHSAVGAVFGLGLIVAAFYPLRNRLWVNLAILYGLVGIGIQVDRYYRGQADVLPPTVLWVAATVLLLALYPTQRRPAAGAEEEPQPRRLSALAQAPASPSTVEPPSGGRRRTAAAASRGESRTPGGED